MSNIRSVAAFGGGELRPVFGEHDLAVFLLRVVHRNATCCMEISDPSSTTTASLTVCGRGDHRCSWHRQDPGSRRRRADLAGPGRAGRGFGTATSQNGNQRAVQAGVRVAQTGPGCWWTSGQERSHCRRPTRVVVPDQAVTQGPEVVRPQLQPRQQADRDGKASGNSSPDEVPLITVSGSQCMTRKPEELSQILDPRRTLPKQFCDTS